MANIREQTLRAIHADREEIQLCCKENCRSGIFADANMDKTKCFRMFKASSSHNDYVQWLQDSSQDGTLSEIHTIAFLKDPVTDKGIEIYAPEIHNFAPAAQANADHSDSEACDAHEDAAPGEACDAHEDAAPGEACDAHEDAAPGEACDAHEETNVDQQVTTAAPDLSNHDTTPSSLRVITQANWNALSDTDKAIQSEMTAVHGPLVITQLAPAILNTDLPGNTKFRYITGANHCAHSGAVFSEEQKAELVIMQTLLSWMSPLVKEQEKTSKNRKQKFAGLVEALLLQLQNKESSAEEQGKAYEATYKLLKLNPVVKISLETAQFEKAESALPTAAERVMWVVMQVTIVVLVRHCNIYRDTNLPQDVLLKLISFTDAITNVQAAFSELLGDLYKSVIGDAFPFDFRRVRVDQYKEQLDAIKEKLCPSKSKAAPPKGPAKVPAKVQYAYAENRKKCMQETIHCVYRAFPDTLHFLSEQIKDMCEHAADDANTAYLKAFDKFCQAVGSSDEFKDLSKEVKQFMQQHTLNESIKPPAAGYCLHINHMQQAFGEDFTLLGKFIEASKLHVKHYCEEYNKSSVGDMEACDRFLKEFRALNTKVHQAMLKYMSESALQSPLAVMYHGVVPQTLKMALLGTEQAKQDQHVFELIKDMIAKDDCCDTLLLMTLVDTTTDKQAEIHADIKDKLAVDTDYLSPECLVLQRVMELYVTHFEDADNGIRFDPATGHWSQDLQQMFAETIELLSANGAAAEITNFGLANHTIQKSAAGKMPKFDIRLHTVTAYNYVAYGPEVDTDVIGAALDERTQEEINEAYRNTRDTMKVFYRHATNQILTPSEDMSTAAFMQRGLLCAATQIALHCVKGILDTPDDSLYLWKCLHGKATKDAEVVTKDDMTARMLHIQAALLLSASGAIRVGNPEINLAMLKKHLTELRGHNRSTIPVQQATFQAIRACSNLGGIACNQPELEVYQKAVEGNPEAFNRPGAEAFFLKSTVNAAPQALAEKLLNAALEYEKQQLTRGMPFHIWPLCVGYVFDIGSQWSGKIKNKTPIDPLGPACVAVHATRGVIGQMLDAVTQPNNLKHLLTSNSVDSAFLPIPQLLQKMRQKVLATMRDSVETISHARKADWNRLDLNSIGASMIQGVSIARSRTLLAIEEQVQSEGTQTFVYDGFDIAVNKWDELVQDDSDKKGVQALLDAILDIETTNVTIRDHTAKKYCSHMLLLLFSFAGNEKVRLGQIRNILNCWSHLKEMQCGGCIEFMQHVGTCPHFERSIEYKPVASLSVTPSVAISSFDNRHFRASLHSLIYELGFNQLAMTEHFPDKELIPRAPALIADTSAQNTPMQYLKCVLQAVIEPADYLKVIDNQCAWVWRGHDPKKADEPQSPQAENTSFFGSIPGLLSTAAKTAVDMLSDTQGPDVQKEEMEAMQTRQDKIAALATQLLADLDGSSLNKDSFTQFEQMFAIAEMNGETVYLVTPPGDANVLYFSRYFSRGAVMPLASKPQDMHLYWHCAKNFVLGNEEIRPNAEVDAKDKKEDASSSVGLDADEGLEELQNLQQNALRLCANLQKMTGELGARRTELEAYEVCMTKLTQILQDPEHNIGDDDKLLELIPSTLQLCQKWMVQYTGAELPNSADDIMKEIQGASNKREKYKKLIQLFKTVVDSVLTEGASRFMQKADVDAGLNSQLAQLRTELMQKTSSLETLQQQLKEQASSQQPKPTTTAEAPPIPVNETQLRSDIANLQQREAALRQEISDLKEEDPETNWFSPRMTKSYAKLKRESEEAIAGLNNEISALKQALQQQQFLQQQQQQQQQQQEQQQQQGQQQKQVLAEESVATNKEEALQQALNQKNVLQAALNIATRQHDELVKNYNKLTTQLSQSVLEKQKLQTANKTLEDENARLKAAVPHVGGTGGLTGSHTGSLRRQYERSAKLWKDKMLELANLQKNLKMALNKKPALSADQVKDMVAAIKMQQEAFISLPKVLQLDDNDEVFGWHRCVPWPASRPLLQMIADDVETLLNAMQHLIDNVVDGSELTMELLKQYYPKRATVSRGCFLTPERCTHFIRKELGLKLNPHGEPLSSGSPGMMMLDLPAAPKDSEAVIVPLVRVKHSELEIPTTINSATARFDEKHRIWHINVDTNRGPCKQHVMKLPEKVEVHLQGNTKTVN